MKKGIVFIEILVILSVLVFVVQFRNRYYENQTQEVLEVLAYEVSESIYDGNQEYFKSLAAQDAFDEIQKVMQSVQGRYIEAYSMEEYADQVKDDNQVIVVNRIEEGPFRRVVLHRIVFIPDKDSWLIREFDSISQ